MTVSPEARRYILDLARAEERPWHGVRLQVIPGCGGPRFLLSLDDPRPGDTEITASELTILADPFSATFLDELVVDYSAEEDDLTFRHPDSFGSIC
ncbi:MAG: hypothetical protein IMX06_02170 [Kyrpidia tusciae]|nr:iron-sulfur cluster biosynthesis family protein [Kyrpidia tusciae]MBE3551654.1 hypothetical protein [Kyrpidia tusciae]